MDDGCSSATLDDAMVDFEPSDDDQDLPTVAEEEEEKDKVPPPELPPIPAIFASFVSAAAWAVMSAATRTLLVNGVPTLVQSIHREAEMLLASQRSRDDEKPRATVSPAITTAVPIEEPETSSAVLHCDGISSRQAAADQEALISSTARFAAQQRRVASPQAGRQDSSHPRATPHTYAAKVFRGLQGPHLAPAPRSDAYVYKRNKIDVAFLGILLTVIASHRQPSFMKHDAVAVMEAADVLARKLKDFPGATLAHALGHAAAPCSTSSWTTSAHELLLALRAAYRNARRPIAWPQLPLPIAPVAMADTRACAVPAVAQRDATGGGETCDHRNGARASQTAYGHSRRGRRQGNMRNPVSSSASKVGLTGRRVGKEKGNDKEKDNGKEKGNGKQKGNGNDKGKGKGRNLHRPAMPHRPPAELLLTPSPALLPPSGGARSSLHLGW